MSEVATWNWKSRFRTGGDYKPDEKFIDILEKSRRRVKRSEHIGSIVIEKQCVSIVLEIEEVNKSVWGMPRLSEAKKDVISCEKLRGVANRL